MFSRRLRTWPSQSLSFAVVSLRAPATAYRFCFHAVFTICGVNSSQVEVHLHSVTDTCIIVSVVPSGCWLHLVYCANFISFGRTSGWFPDGVGNKPWLDQSTSECIPTMLSLACISAPPLSSFNDFVVKVYSIGIYSWLRDVLTGPRSIHSYLPSSLFLCLLHPTSTRFSHPRTLIPTDLRAVVFLCFCRSSPPFSHDDHPLSSCFPLTCRFPFKTASLSLRSHYALAVHLPSLLTAPSPLHSLRFPCILFLYRVLTTHSTILDAMKDFANAKDKWLPTWPADVKERALAV